MDRRKKVTLKKEVDTRSISEKKIVHREIDSTILESTKNPRSIGTLSPIKFMPGSATFSI